MRTNPDPILVLDDVYKFYRPGITAAAEVGNKQEEPAALRGVNASFRAGSFWAIMGPSGSGKSTLLNLLGCLDRPSAGRCLLFNQDVGLMDDDELSDLRLQRLGFIFQSFNLIPQLTVLENIELPLFYQNMDPASSTRRGIELAGLVGLSHRLTYRPQELSGGQQQRVAVARAMANDPDILLADEPTGNLDSATSTRIIKLLLELNRRGKTIIMVTHEPEIAAYARCRLYLRDGMIDRVDEGVAE